jgi:hypothetical protein
MSKADDKPKPKAPPERGDLMSISGPVVEGTLIPRPPTPLDQPVPKKARFYNWGKPRKGKPYGIKFKARVPRDSHHLSLAAGSAVVVDGPEEAKRAVASLQRAKAATLAARIGAKPKADKTDKE